MKQIKSEIRKKYRKRIKEIPAEYFKKSGRAICGSVIKTNAWITARTVFVYASLPTEADTTELLTEAIRSGKRLCVPKITAAGKMDAVEIESLSQLKPGKFGIPEPIEECKAVTAQEIDLIVMPCLAAGEDGTRLGKGGGFYDRFCENYSGKKMVLCPEAVLCKSGELPFDFWDINADAVVSENRIISVKD